MDRHFKEHALEILDRVGVALMMAGGADMRKQGEILSHFEALGRLAESEHRNDIPEAVAAADAIVTAFLFRDDLRDRWAEGSEFLSRLITICRESCDTGKSCGADARAVFREARARLHIRPDKRVSEPPPAPEAEGPAEQVPLDKDRELYADFASEAAEHLDAIEVKMVDLEANPGDTETVNAIFRGFHTIKGVSGFLDLGDVNGLSHRVESLLDLARRGDLAVTSTVTDVVFEAVDALRAMIRDVADKASAGAPSRALRDTRAILARIDGIRDGKAAPDRAMLPLGDVLVEQGKVTRKDVDEAVEAQSRTAPGRPIGEILIEAKKVSPRAVAEALRVQMTGAPAEDAKHVRIDVHKLDGLVDTVGEMVIAQTLVCNDPGVAAIEDQRFYRNMAQLGRVTSELQRIAMSMRMVPVRNTFQKMSRMVRDLARKSGKSVVLVSEGEETEIDRNMVEEIHDPLVHLIRNSVDHGIESADGRAAAGKPAQGTVTLRARHQGGSVIISVEDDGRGLDTGKILEKAIERGALPEGAQPTDAEIVDLLFEAGFSTAAEVTEISGRGVGLDVVRRNVEKLRGTVEAKSRPGKGAVFSMKLPLTLAIIDAIVVKVGKQRYLVATHAVVEAMRPTRQDCFTVENRAELVRVRGELLPLVRLHALFRVPDAQESLTSALVVVVEAEGEKRALLVDDLLGKQQVVIKGLGGGMEGGRGVSGGAIMGDGRVGLILDVPGIVALAGRKRAAV